MKGIKKILFPVDLSDVSPILVPYVAMMAKKFEAEIHLLFVVRDFAYFTDIYVENLTVDSFSTEITEGAKKRLKEFKESYFLEHPNTKAMVVAGYVPEVITNYIQSEGIDLLIMGTHGRKGLEKVIFGSVAERMVKTAPVPVFLVNPHRVHQ